MFRVIEEIDTRMLGFAGNQAVFGLVGKTSNELLGVQCQLDDKVRTIIFSDIDKLTEIAKTMTGGK